MDRDRFKRKETQAPIKRSINGEEKPFAVRPTVLPQPQTIITPTRPSQTAQSVSLDKPSAPVGSPKDTTKTNIPSLFDGDDDEDLFGVWATQKKLKKARQQKEMQEKAAKLAAKMLKKQQKKDAKRAAKPHEFAFSVSVPRVSKFKNKHPKLAYSLLAVAVIAVGFGVFTVVSNNKTTSNGATEVLGQVAAKPDFATVYSSSDKATVLKYDASKKVASYSDVINGTTVTISQQLLPSGFQSDPTGEVAKLAAQINATEKISASDVTAYAGLSAKGPQTVVFAKNDLLIFIIADKKIETLDWMQYLETIK